MTAESAPRLGRNVTALAGGQVVTWLMTLMWTFVVPRALGPAGMGLIVSAWSVTGIFGVVLGLGARNYLTREMVLERPRSSQLIGTAIILRLILAPVFFIGIIIYSHFARYGRDGTMVLYLAAGATMLTLLSEPMQAGFQAIERMEYLAYSDVINKSAQGLLGVALALLGFRAVGITACWLVVSGIVIFLDALWMRPHVRIQLRASGRQLIEMTRESIAYWAFGLFFMVYLWIDSMMLSLMTRPAVVGWYGVPTTLFQTMLFIPVILGTAWLPRLVNAFAEGGDQLRRVAKVPLEWVLALSLPLCAATALGAGPVIHLLYGSAYSRAVPVMVILGLCLPPMYLNIMLCQVLIASKRQVVWTWVMAGATVVNPLLNSVLIQVTQHRYGNGAIGAAASLVATEILIVAVGFIVVGGGVFDRRSALRCLRVGLASAGMVAVGVIAHPLGAAASLASAAVAFLVLALVLHVMTSEELDLLGHWLRRTLGRGPARHWRSRGTRRHRDRRAMAAAVVSAPGEPAGLVGAAVEPLPVGTRNEP